MSPHDELRAAQRCVDDVARCLSRLDQQPGGWPDGRRPRRDANHPRESREPTEGSDAPYDHRPWVGADDEGLGCRH